MNNSSSRGVKTALCSGLSRILESEGDAEFLLQQVCDYLNENMENCDWAGYYLVDPESEEELFLGPFSGEPTEHTRIGFGEGICGQAASTGKTFVIADVGIESNYLSCSPEVKSEIVVPVFHDRTMIGEIDLDSYVHDGFSEDDRVLLEWLANLTSELAEQARKAV
ncbi:MAG: GAF domain-containing protein, partial [Candidatus Aegiribacteria sp.]|nr:GAF domain-containing protein [Candidatus Aegiribacteria sp.]